MQELWRRVRSWSATATGRGVLVTAGYTAATVVLTWPIVGAISRRLGGDYGDGFMFTWNLWFFKESVVSLGNPFFTDLLYFPEGADLRLHSMSWASCALSLPLQLVASPLTAYNLLLLFYYVHAGVCMYALCRELGSSPAAAFFGGWLFTFSPFHFAHGLGHLNLMGTGWVPLHLLFVIRTLREGDWKNAVWASLTFVVAALTSWYFATFCMVATAVLFAWKLITTRSSRNRRTLYNLLIVAVVAAVLLAPFMWPIVAIHAQGQLAGSHPVDHFGTDLLSLALPSRRLALAGWMSDPLARICLNPSESSGYLGYAALALTILAVVRARNRDLSGCLLVGAVALLLSLGTVLRVNGHPHLWCKLPFYGLYEALPVFRIGTVASRFNLLVLLALSCGVAAGLHYLWRQSVRARVLAVGLAVIAALEYLPRMPHPTAHVPPPPVMRQWAKTPQHFAVLDSSSTAHQNWYQITHRKPLIQGYSARRPARSVIGLVRDPVVGPLQFGRSRGRFPRYERAVSALEKRGVRFFIAGPEHPWRRELMERYFDFPRVFANRRMSIYRVERRRRLVHGFSAPRFAGNRVTWWSEGRRSLLRFSRDKKSRGGLELIVEASPYASGRVGSFAVIVNGTGIGTVRLEPGKRVRRTLALPSAAVGAGPNHVEFLYDAPGPVELVDLMGALVEVPQPAVVFNRIEIVDRH